MKPYPASGHRAFHPVTRGGLIALLLALLAAMPVLSPTPAAAAPETAEGELTFERWYVLRLEGDRIGYAHMRMHETAERITTSADTFMSIRRGPVAMEIEQSTRFTETHEGEPIEARSLARMGQMAVDQTLRFMGDEVELITRQADREQTRRFPASEADWLPPAAAQRYIEQQFAAEAERIELRTIEPSLGHEPFTITMRVIGEEDVEVLGKVVPAIVWEAELSVMPGMAVREYVDRRGQALRTTLQLAPGMEIEMIEADEAVATAEVDPPELLAAMFISPNEPIASPRRLRGAAFELTLDESVDPVRFDPPQTGYQRVVWGDERTARIVIDLAQPATAGHDLPNDEHLAASMMLDHEDPKIRALVDEALGDEAATLDDNAKADRLRAFVYDYVTEKDLAVGLATASEVARTRQGDCTEHAVLLAAMLRAAGIPARAATGLIYVDEFIGHEGVFGGHMWTQAWLPATDGGGRAWVDLDATLPDRATDAARITLGVSAMSDAGGNDLVGMIPLLGGLEIEVLYTRPEASD